jgi:hypothetical protein
LGFGIAAADATAKAQRVIAYFRVGLFGGTVGIEVDGKQIGGYLAVRPKRGSVRYTSHKDGTQDINARRPISKYSGNIYA